MADIPTGQHTRVDDEQAIGGTIRFLKKLLPTEVEIEDNFLYLETDLGYKSFTDVYAKDFMFRSFDSSLVVKLSNNEFARMPYFFPYVNLCIRVLFRLKTRFDLV